MVDLNIQLYKHDGKKTTDQEVADVSTRYILHCNELALRVAMEDMKALEDRTAALVDSAVNQVMQTTTNGCYAGAASAVFQINGHDTVQINAPIREFRAEWFKDEETL